MSTSTPRLALIMPAAGDSMALGDDALAGNYSKIDTAMGIQIGAVQPAATFSGQLWDNTTADDKRIFDGATFKPFQKDTWQKGEVARQVAAASLKTTGEFTILQQDVSMINGAKYLIRWSTFLKWDAGFTPVAGGVFSIKTKINAATVKTRALPDFGGKTTNLGGTFSGFYEHTAVATAVTTISLSLNGTGGLGNSAWINPSGSPTYMSAERWNL